MGPPPGPPPGPPFTRKMFPQMFLNPRRSLNPRTFSANERFPLCFLQRESKILNVYAVKISQLNPKAKIRGVNEARVELKKCTDEQV